MMDFGDDFRDFAPLDPRLDERRWEGLVNRVMEATGPELARRADTEPLLLTLLSGWARPAFSATAAVAAAAIAILVLRGPDGGAGDPARAGALGYPQALADWMEADFAPSLEELVFSLEGEPR